MFNFLAYFQIIFSLTKGIENVVLNSAQLQAWEPFVYDTDFTYTDLYLYGKQITSIGAGVFNGLNSLQELWLDDNQINSIQMYTFTGANNLQSLRLENNQINFLDQNAFNNLGNGLVYLGDLDLSYNKLTQLGSSVFKGLAGLWLLGLS